MDPLISDATSNDITSLNSLSNDTEFSFRLRQRYALRKFWFQQNFVPPNQQMWEQSDDFVGWYENDSNECNWTYIFCYHVN